VSSRLPPLSFAAHCAWLNPTAGQENYAVSRRHCGLSPQADGLTKAKSELKPIVFACVFLMLLGNHVTAFSQTPQIYVGANVHVSQAHETYPMGEVLISADPSDRNRLLGCGIVYAESENRRWTVVYLSKDAGKTWQPTLETKRFEDSSDPACSLGRNGLASHVTIGHIDEKQYVLGVYRSVDGGQTWAQQEDMPMTFQGIDRESLTIDTTQGKFRDTTYISGASIVQDLGGGYKDAFAVWRSRDGGATYEGPLKRSAIANHSLLQTGNGVILSDGTLVSLFADVKNSDGYIVPGSTPQERNAVLEAVTTTDGGDSLSQAVKVDDFFMVWGLKHSGALTLGMPTIAVDPSDSPFRDRLYATWADQRDGRSEIRFSYSADKGKTWSRSTVIDDVLEPADKASGPNNFLPTVAVNKASVVAVTWYDRRENPDGLGWYVRMSMSLDGGDTWTPSVRVSEKPNIFSPYEKVFTWASVVHSGADSGAIEVGPEHEGSIDKEQGRDAAHVSFALQGRQFYAGDYAGLAADAAGTFHAFWVDNRTGLAQIWTAPIVVEGKAIRNGSAGLAELNDVSGAVELMIVSTYYDRTSNVATIGIRLKNTSKKVIQGPLKLRLVNITSALGRPFPANADNQLTRPGAVWDFSRLLNDNVLKPYETSAVRQLIFRLDNPREFSDGKGIRNRLLDFDIRVLAGGTKP